MKRRLLIFVTLAGLIAASAAMLRTPSLASRIDVADEEIETARAEFQNYFLAQPDDQDTIMWLAEKAVVDERWERAERLFAYIPSSHDRYGRSARHQQGQLLLRLNRSVEAEGHLREFLELERHAPESPREFVIDATQRLRSILETQLRFAERRRLIQQMVRNGEGDVFDAVFYCFPNLLRWNGTPAISRLEAYIQNDPGDLRLRVALGRYRAARGKLDEARKILQPCLDEHPDDLAVVAAWLELLKEQADWDSLHAHIETLDAPQPDQPWHLLRIRGHAASRQKDFTTAIHCFELALQSDPANPECYNGLAACYRGLKRTEEQQTAAARAQVLTRIQNRLGWTQTSPDDVKPFVEIVDLCLEIELFEQAWVMARLAGRMAPTNVDVIERIKLTSKSYQLDQ